MATPFSSIQDHQRILITGPRKREILEYCSKVLNHYQKEFAFIDESGELVGESESIVFIISGGEAQDFQAHIALIDEVSNEEFESYTDLANSIPKSGTLVFNTENVNANNICASDRVDVHKETFAGDPSQAARGLLRRIGVNDERFDSAVA